MARWPLFWAAAAAALSFWLPLARAAPDACGAQGGDRAILRVRTLREEALSRIPPPQAIDSRHIAVVVPAAVERHTGAGVAAFAYASLPQEAKAGKLPATVFTKFVVVSHSSQKGPKGISVGDDVCSDAGFADPAAVRFLRTEMMQRLKDFSPPIVSCAVASNCPERMSPGLDGQLPFLRSMRGEEPGGQPLRGDLLPIMLHSQDVELAVKVGAALSLLVQPGGVWEGERVLFVFSGDMSAGLPAAQALHCDDLATQILTRRGPAQAAEYFHTLLSGGADEGCKGPESAPVGFGPMLAASRLASDLRMLNRRVNIAHEGAVKGISKGFASIFFWADSHSIWEQHAEAAAQAGALLEDGTRGHLRSRTRRTRKQPESEMMAADAITIANAAANYAKELDTRLTREASARMQGFNAMVAPMPGVAPQWAPLAPGNLTAAPTS